MSKAIRPFGPSNPDPDTVLETWVAGDGRHHRLRFDIEQNALVVEHHFGYSDIGYVWDYCPFAYSFGFHIPDFNSTPDPAPTPSTQGPK